MDAVGSWLVAHPGWALREGPERGWASLFDWETWETTLASSEEVANVLLKGAPVRHALARLEEPQAEELGEELAVLQLSRWERELLGVALIDMWSLVARGGWSRRR
ncbi:MAG: hypothetical protein ACRDYC_07550 [Acidimicrobiales bacterium]